MRKAWADYNKSSRGQWKVDPVQLHNNGYVLAYLPSGEFSDGELGSYIWIYRNGDVEAGVYIAESSVITNNLFTPLWRRSYGAYTAALRAVTERTGLTITI